MADNEEQKQEEEQSTDWGSFLENLQNEENPIPTDATPPEDTPPPPPVDTPPPPPSVSPEFLGTFTGMYNKGIDAGYTPFAEGLGDNARYGDASKDWSVGQDPAAILVPAFSGQGGIMGEGIRGAFGLINKEFGRQGREQIKPDEFVKQAREGTLTRVFPQEDPTTGDVYRIYQYGDEKYGTPRFTKEKVYEAPKAPTRPAGSFGGPQGPQGPKGPQDPQRGPTRDADTQAAQAKMVVPPGWATSGAYKDGTGAIVTVLSKGDENRQFTYIPSAQRWEQTWPPPAQADLAGLNQAPRTAGGPPPPPTTGVVPGVGVNGTPYTGPAPSVGASGAFVPNQSPPPTAGWMPANGTDWSGAMYHPNYGVISQDQYRALVGPIPKATGTPVAPGGGTNVPPPTSTPSPSGTPNPAWRPADGSNPYGPMYNNTTGELIPYDEYVRRTQGR